MSKIKKDVLIGRKVVALMVSARPGDSSPESSEVDATVSERPADSVVVKFVDRSRMQVLNQREPLASYVKRLWQTRHFITAHSRSSAFQSGQGTFLGKLWIVLDPIAQISIYALVFGLILQTNRGIENFLGFLTLGVVFFRFLTAGLSNGGGLIQRNRNLISSFNFPRASIPLGSGVTAAFANLIPALVATVLALSFQKWQNFSLATFSVIPLFLLIHVWAAGATFFTARITAFVPDARNLIRIVIQGLFFVSGLFYSIDRFDDHPLLANLMKFNPLYQFLNAVRTAVLDGQFPPLSQWIYLLCWSFGMLIFGFIYFWRADGAYARVK